MLGDGKDLAKKGSERGELGKVFRECDEVDVPPADVERAVESRKLLECLGAFDEVLKELWVEDIATKIVFLSFACPATISCREKSVLLSFLLLGRVGTKG